jgi:hypothetical protein
MYISTEFILDLRGEIATSAFFTSNLLICSIIYILIIWAVL